MYKLLALDMDGTLLNSKHQISTKNKDMVNKARKAGIKVVLLSGREPGSIKHYSKQLELNEVLSGFNGGIITDNKVEKIYLNQCLEAELAKKTIALAEKDNMCIVIFLLSEILICDGSDERYSIFDKYVIIPVKEVGKLSEYLEANNLWSNINKILVSDDNDTLKKFKSKLEIETEDKMSLLFSLSFFLEVFSKEVSKGVALKEIAKHYDVKREEIIAIGDGENDISMIEYAGFGVAMGNSPNNVKEIADYVTLSNKEDGVSHVIEKYLLV